MEFRTKLVLGKKNKKARLSVLGALVLLVGVFMAMADGYERYALWTFVAGVVLLVVGAILAKGDLSDIEVSDSELVISRDGIRIGEEFYTMGLIQNMDFRVEGFDGMRGKSYDSPTEGIINGMDNYLTFEVAGEEISCIFYLPGPAKVQELGLLFRDFYAQKIHFIERNGAYRTFLFKTMSDKERGDAMMVNGYI
jgi:hypothetical protein